MQTPVSHEAMPGKIHESKFSQIYTDNLFKPIRPGSALPFQFQKQLKSLREYVNECRSALNGIQKDFEHFKLDPDNPSILSGMAKQLGRFSLEADSWGFQSLNELTLALQKVLLDSVGRDWNNGLSEAFEKGLDFLSALVERCETDFCWDYALNETLECLSRAGQNPVDWAG